MRLRPANTPVTIAKDRLTMVPASMGEESADENEREPANKPRRYSGPSDAGKSQVEAIPPELVMMKPIAIAVARR